MVRARGSAWPRPVWLPFATPEGTKEATRRPHATGHSVPGRCHGPESSAIINPCPMANG